MTIMLAALAGLALAGAVAAPAGAAPKDPWSPSEKYAEASVTGAYVRFVTTAPGTIEERAITGWKWNNGCVVQPGDVINRFVRNSDGSFEIFTNIYTWGSSNEAGPRGDRCTTAFAEPKTYTAKFVVDSSYGRLAFSSDEARNFEIIWVDTRKPRVALLPSKVAGGQVTAAYTTTDDSEWATVRFVVRSGSKVLVDTYGYYEDATGKPKSVQLSLPTGTKGRVAVCLTPEDKAKNKGAPSCRTLVVR